MLQHLIFRLCLHLKCLTPNTFSILAPWPPPPQWPSLSPSSSILPPPWLLTPRTRMCHISHSPSYLTYCVKTSQSLTRLSRHLPPTCSRPLGPWWLSFPSSTINCLHFLLDWLRSNDPALCLLSASTFNSFTQLSCHHTHLANPNPIWTHIHHPRSFLTFSVLLENNIPAAQTVAGINWRCSTLSKP